MSCSEGAGEVGVLPVVKPNGETQRDPEVRNQNQRSRAKSPKGDQTVLRSSEGTKENSLEGNYGVLTDVEPNGGTQGAGLL